MISIGCTSQHLSFLMSLKVHKFNFKRLIKNGSQRETFIKLSNWLSLVIINFIIIIIGRI
jgi:hypothetical protein